MVLINGVKYACERCIRGHRVTTCTHTDQPLMMIKPKGRPSTTCDHCKELRKNKNANPSGVCTCGRLEKKRLAQKAKEEARAKAKEEKKLHECRCGSDEPCKCHSNRRSRTSHTRKLKNNNVGGSISSRPSSQHLDSASIGGVMGHVMSPVSMDSSSSIQNGNTSNNNINGSVKAESSSFFPSGFLDTGEFNGKVSKDYHQVPSLASISSLHSGQSPSFDQKLGFPQSPLLTGFKNSGGNFLNWGDEGGSFYPAKSDSGVNLLENENPNSSVSGNTNTSSINNFPNDLGFGVYFGVNNGSTNGNENGNENGNGNVNDNVNSGKSMNTSPMMKKPVSKVPFGEHTEPSEINRGQTSNISGNGTSASLNDWNADKSLDVGTLTNYAQNNGLFDIFMDSSTIPALSKDSLMAQQDKFDYLNENNGNQGSVKSNTNSNYNRNSNSNYNENNKTNSNITGNGNANHNQYRCGTWVNPLGTDRFDTVSADDESIRSIEGAPLIPSFMDIPERAPSLHNAYPASHQQQHPPNQQQKQIKRSSSANRSLRHQPSARPAVPITINPSMVSSIDDTISVTSLQSPASSLIDNNGFSTSLSNGGGDFENSHPLFERSKSPQLGIVELTNATMPTSPQSSKQRSNIHASSAQAELDRLLGLDAGNTNGLIDNVAISESNNNGNSNGNSVLQSDAATISSPPAKGVLDEASLMSSNQATSPPSQLFTEQGFADLDDFMSTL
ncbi:hypothetical protein ZYGR_0AS02090 [Zygosaccharomyces rouxii]|uniref:Copper-fist domain-containing protein n=1 Tax=Zygosaccharomyces rouxii TaxID=4956 RepID=A0A1Q3AGI6_ZYGRO|nr:hypothetical protein ZYGR_0AS02090 [Zygosaccharomyces rouxii]